MAEMGDSLPYRAEYAKSGRSSCKKCKENILQGLLRLAVVFQSTKFDGKMTSWYHFDCFFERQRPKTVGDIEHFDQLRWEDQEKITKKIESLAAGGGVVAVPAKKGKGKAAKGKTTALKLQDYNIEYAKSGRAACRSCLEKISKDEIRISKKNFDPEARPSYGPVDQWYHVKCFKEKREELGLIDSVEKVMGFESLKAEDQKKLLKELPAIQGTKHKIEPTDEVDGASGAKRVKKEDDKEEAKAKEELKKQSKTLYKYRDELDTLSKTELEELAEYNDQQTPSGKSEILDFLADLMMFGALEPCSECKKGQFYYKSGVGYVCSGNLSEWTKCPNTTTTPARKPFKVPSELSDAYEFLKKYKYVPRQRIIPALPTTGPKVPVKEEAIKPEPTVPPLKGHTFILDSNLENSKEVQQEVEKLGGKIGSRITGKVTAYVATKKQVKEMDAKMEKVKDTGLPVVPVDYFEEVRAHPSSAMMLLTKKNLAKWECPEVEKRAGKEKAAREGKSTSSKSSSGKSSGKSMPEKMTLTLKGGGVVDPESGLEDEAHVVKTKDALYSVVLGVVDIQQGRNSYYKLQILKHDKKDKWYLFRSWGRVGTTIGDKKTESFDDKQEAIEAFVALYEEKTGNAWKNRNNFVKQPGKLYPLDIDYGDAESQTKLSSENSTSKLSKPVQELICMLFDIETMKRAMVEFELDLTKMPLGKLSKKQLEKAYGILGEAQKLLDASDVHEAKFLDISNQFYTLIPHDFGKKSPPLLKDADLIKSKLEMLESLMEIEIAFNLLKAGDAVKDKDPIDAHYEKLNTEIEVLDKSSEEFKLIQTYAKNTHASTHTQYTLEIEEVFKVARKNEAKRFKPFSKLPRKLLWHGSRTANYAGILSQGLRIAPPEAPVTGYMFGKGIYFADMISKSANYCVTSKSNPTGLLLLSDVALGKIYERTEADYIEKLKSGYHSVLGVGKTQPDPDEFKMMGDVKVPLGKPVPSSVKKTTLLYNEYIVYDVAQVNIKYLVKTKFHYK